MYETIFVPLSVLCPWITGMFAVSGKSLMVQLANVFFGVFPAGKSSYNIPFQNISGCILDKYYDTGNILTGGFLCITGGACLIEPSTIFVGLLMILFGIILILYGIRTVIRIQNSGTELAIAVPFYARDKAEKIKNMIDKSIA